MEENLEPSNNKDNNEKSDDTTSPNPEIIKISNSQQINNQGKGVDSKKNGTNSINNFDSKVEIKNDIDQPNKIIPKSKKEIPLEKKPFQEFINIHLIPALIKEINQRGLEVNNINLENTNRPITRDKCL